MTNNELSLTLEVFYSLDLIVSFLEDKEFSRTRLIRSLGIVEKTFSTALEYGCASGYLQRAPGNMFKVAKQYKIPEDSFYPIVRTGLENLWRKERYDNSEFYIEQTARKDSKIAGPWTRPGLTLVSYKKFPWTIGSEFDVVTFEVKRPDSCNVLAVFEALSHASAATRAYVVFPKGRR